VSRRGGGLGGETVEGVQAVRELLRAERRRVHELWLARDDLDELDELAARSGVPVRRVPPARLARAAATAAPQGVLARAEPIPAASYERLLEDAACFLAAFDGVTDPQNLGAALRAAATAGAAGAVEYLPIAVVSGIPAALSRARRRGVWAVGLAEDGTADVFDLPCADERLVLVAGAEGRGLGRLTRQRCDLLARIPVAGPLPSLNVATAVAVAAHAVAHRRRVPVPSRDAPE
jgi:23S rRNA (guanosine2251-2'-O)-methyltransferase